MALKSYYVGKNSVVRRLDSIPTNIGGIPWSNWVTISPSSFFGTAADLRDVMTVPGEPDKVFVVGLVAQGFPFKGIGYSLDAGQNWTMPGILSIPINPPRSFYEVWVLDNNTVYVAGESGWILKGSLIGSNYTFDFSLTAQIAGGLEDCYSVHFQDSLKGVAGLETKVAITNDGGLTWSLINIAGVSEIKGIYRNDNQIVAVCDTKIIYTSNYLSGFQEILWSSYGADDIKGNHLTWYKSSPTAVPTFWATTNRNLIVTNTGGTGVWSIFNSHVYQSTSGSNNQFFNNYLAAHFYQLDKGFLGLTNGTFGDTQLDYYQAPSEIGNVDAFPGCKALEAVWTEQTLPTCYLIRNCTTNQEYVTNTDLSSYVNQVLYQITINDQRSNDCYLVVGSTNCIQNTVSVGLSAGFSTYTTCIECLSRCYKLTNCQSPDDFIVYTPSLNYDPLEDYLYQVVQLPELCTDKCYFVEKTPCPNNPQPIPQNLVIVSYANCDICLGKPPVQDLHVRAVKPGFYTPGCPPDYTVKTSCMFATQYYDEMVSIRYGISICCDHDVDKWEIKKELLELSGIYDPDLCKTVTCTTNNAPCNVTASISTYQVVPYNPPSDPDCVTPIRPIASFLPDPL
jgi:hypothetical protein